MKLYPLVSIVIPVYNGSDYLRQAIDSALEQTYKNIEVIVVNDGSNDGGETERIALSYGNKIRCFYKENGGVSSALNIGIKEMKGEWFSWLSHDDLYYPNKIEIQMSNINSSDNKIILFSDYEFIDEKNCFLREYYCPEIPKEEFVKMLAKQSFINGCTLLIPKFCFDEIGLFNESLKTTQDYEMWFRCLKNKYVFKHIPRILLKSRLHGGQGSITMGKSHEKEKDNLFIWFLSYFTSDEISFKQTNYTKRYLDLALNFKQRGFYEASVNAEKLAYNYLRKKYVKMLYYKLYFQFKFVYEEYFNYVYCKSLVKRIFSHIIEKYR